MAGGSWHRGWSVPWVTQPTQWWSLWYDQQGIMVLVLLRSGKSWSSLSPSKAGWCPLGMGNEMGGGQFECWVESVQSQAIQVCEIKQGDIFILALWTPSKASFSCPSSNLPQMNEAMKGKVLCFCNCQLCLNSGMSCQVISHPPPQGWPSLLFIQVGSLPKVCWCVSVIMCVPIIRQNCYRDKFLFISMRTRGDIAACQWKKKRDYFYLSQAHMDGDVKCSLATRSEQAGMRHPPERLPFPLPTTVHPNLGSWIQDVRCCCLWESEARDPQNVSDLQGECFRHPARHLSGGQVKIPVLLSRAMCGDWRPRWAGDSASVLALLQ